MSRLTNWSRPARTSIWQPLVQLKPWHNGCSIITKNWQLMTNYFESLLVISLTVLQCANTHMLAPHQPICLVDSRPLRHKDQSAGKTSCETTLQSATNYSNRAHSQPTCLGASSLPCSRCLLPLCSRLRLQLFHHRSIRVLGVMASVLQVLLQLVSPCLVGLSILLWLLPISWLLSSLACLLSLDSKAHHQQRFHHLSNNQLLRTLIPT